MKDKLKSAMKEAMKAREKVKLETIRSLLAAIQYEEMQKGVDDISSEATVTVLKREMKKRTEAIEYTEQANRAEELEQLKIEMDTIETFLPSQLSEDQIEKIILDLKTQDPEINMGLAMKALKESYTGQYDGKIASTVAKKLLG